MKHGEKWYNEENGKVVPFHAMKADRGNRSTVPFILNLCTR
jgi:hypothetical protein